MKREWRTKLKEERAAFCGPARDEADKSIARIFLEEFSACESFLVYRSFGSEARTDIIIDGLRARGKRVFLPRVEGKELAACPYGETRAGAFGIREPTGEAFSGHIDVCVLPLLAVNGSGYRLGYGGGYYDRYLKRSDALRVGIGYAFQLVCAPFEEAWDEPVHCFISERGICRFG